MNAENKIFEEAHKRDDGEYAILGMKYQCASYFNIDIHSDKVLMIVESYLESVNGYDFFEYLRSKEAYDLMKEE